MALGYVHPDAEYIAKGLDLAFSTKVRPQDADYIVHSMASSGETTRSTALRSSIVPFSAPALAVTTNR